MKEPVTPVTRTTPGDVYKKTVSLRFPCFITLGLSVTSCNRCAARSLVYAAVIDGMERKLDPLPLSMTGLAAAVAGHRWVAVVRPWGEPIAHRASTGHWWVSGIGESFRPTLLAEHVHDSAPLDVDVELAVALLQRFLPADAVPRDHDAPPPF